jgi:hypothetical protein
MLAVAVFACAFAGFGVRGGVAFLVVTLILALPIVRAGRGRMFGAAAWVSSLYPVLFVFSLYATWLFGWCALGHRPRAYGNELKTVNPLVDAARDATDLLMRGAPCAFVLCIALVAASIALSNGGDRLHRRKAAAHLLITVLAWSAPFALSGWNLLQFDTVFQWFKH